MVREIMRAGKTTIFFLSAFIGFSDLCYAMAGPIPLPSSEWFMLPLVVSAGIAFLCLLNKDWRRALIAPILIVAAMVLLFLFSLSSGLRQNCNTFSLSIAWFLFMFSPWILMISLIVSLIYFSVKAPDGTEKKED